MKFLSTRFLFGYIVSDRRVQRGHLTSLFFCCNYIIHLTSVDDWRDVCANVRCRTWCVQNYVCEYCTCKYCVSIQSTIYWYSQQQKFAAGLLFLLDNLAFSSNSPVQKNNRKLVNNSIYMKRLQLQYCLYTIAKPNASLQKRRIAENYYCQLYTIIYHYH